MLACETHFIDWLEPACATGLVLTALAAVLIGQLVQAGEVAAVSNAQRELARANSGLISGYWGIDDRDPELEPQLRGISREVLRTFVRIEGGYYQLAQGHGSEPALVMSACIVVAQAVMMPVSLLAGELAGRWGRKPVFLIGFAVLPVRALLYATSANPYFLVSLQVLDGVAAGIFGVLGVLVASDLTRGTGRFNLLQGSVSTATGIGATASNLLAGFIVAKSGYNSAFVVLAAIAAAGLPMLLEVDARDWEQHRSWPTTRPQSRCMIWLRS